MLDPAALGIRPQYIADYLEKIASACSLERVWLCCHGLELNTNVDVAPRITLVKGSDMIDGNDVKMVTRNNFDEIPINDMLPSHLEAFLDSNAPRRREE